MPTCFSGRTVVSTVKGMVPISEIVVGDLVAAFDFATGDTVFAPVRSVDKRSGQRNLFRFLVGSEIIEVTGNHPIWSAEENGNADLGAFSSYADNSSSTDGKWVDAQFLKNGDKLVSLKKEIMVAENWTSGSDCVGLLTPPKPEILTVFGKSRIAKAMDVFNLKIDGFHCFIVGVEKLIASCRS